MIKENFTWEEAEKVCLLRALEWGALPIFATQFFVPISFLFWVWWKVILFLFIATYLWHPFKYKIVNYRVANFICIINNPLVRWGVAISVGVYFLLVSVHPEMLFS